MLFISRHTAVECVQGGLHFHFFRSAACCCRLLLYLYHTILRALHLVAAIVLLLYVAALQGLPLVTATNGASASMRVRSCGCAILNATSRTIPTHTPSDLQKHPRNTAAVQKQQQQQRYNTSEPRTGSHTQENTPVFLLFNL